MAKIVLGNRPETFKRKVKIQLIEGGEADIIVDFIYRDKVAYGQLLDEHAELRKQKAEGSEDFTFSSNAAQGVELDAAFILKIIKGWDLSDPLNEDNVKRLLIEFAGAGEAIVDSYRLACLEAKRGN